MREYEITFLMENEQAVQEKAVEKAIKNHEGEIISVKNWGQRNLAYPIKKLNSAFYVTVVFNMLPDSVRKLNRTLRLDRSIMRYLIIQGANEVKPEEDYRKYARSGKSKEKPENIIKLKEDREIIKTEEKPTTEKAKTAKTVKKVAVNATKPKTTKEESKETKPKTTKPKKEGISDDERLKQLENKLQDLLKE